tara:strand:- start:675 stop:863 length:189 start_codon:yes stop_codon:yes gene_type:complete
LNKKHCKKCEITPRYEETYEYWYLYEFIYITGYCLDCLIEMGHLPNSMKNKDKLEEFFEGKN